MRFSDIDSLNFSLLPTEVLRALKAKVDDALGKRSHLEGSFFKPGMTSKKREWRIQIDKVGNRRKETIYLEGLLKERWDHLFDGSKDRKFYVYAHVVPSNKKIVFDCSINMHFPGVPFYIGKGTGDRAYDLKRNQGHGATLQELLKMGKVGSDIVYIIAENLTEPEALALESKLIYFFGTKYEKDRDGILVNLDIPKRLNSQ